MKPTSRRTFLKAAAMSTPTLTFGQGIKLHQAATQLWGKISGQPFRSQFVDIGLQQGLTTPAVYGETETKKYILETIGCGCAFLDYDNDGYIDLFVLSGTTSTAAPTSIRNRLYHNNRDGTFTDLKMRAGLFSQGWACGVCVEDYNNGGFKDFLLHGEVTVRSTAMTGTVPSRT